jgi:hypothetical protein
MRSQAARAVDGVRSAIVRDILRELSRMIAGFTRFKRLLGCAMAAESSNSPLNGSERAGLAVRPAFCELRRHSGTE